MNSHSSSRWHSASASSRGSWRIRAAHFFGAAAWLSLWILALALVEMMPLAAQTETVRIAPGETVKMQALGQCEQPPPVQCPEPLPIHDIVLRSMTRDGKYTVRDGTDKRCANTGRLIHESTTSNEDGTLTIIYRLDQRPGNVRQWNLCVRAP